MASIAALFLTITLLLALGTSATNSSNEQNHMSDVVVDNLLQTLQHVHPLWLRERCREPFYADEETRQPRYNLHEEVEDLSIQAIQIFESEQQARSGYLVTFSDGNACHFEENMLLSELDSKETFLQALEWQVPPTYIWDKSLVSPPVFEHDDIVSESDQTRKFLSTLISVGIAVVSNVPRTEGECARFGSKFSTLRDTEWGTNFNVRSTPDTASGGTVRKDLAYTTHRIGMHIDSPYRIDTPPAYQLLHAIDHCHGEACYVHNRFVDGLAVAQALCTINPLYFEILSQVVLRWENNGGDDSSLLYRNAPMIELEAAATTTSHDESSGTCPPVKSINFSAKSGGYAPHLPRDQLDEFYTAKRIFSSLLHHGDYTIRVQLYPGALVIFDNRRVLHSRSDIADSDGERWLQGCYLNRDGIHYHYERLRRKWSHKLTETPFRTLREAQKEDYDRMGVEYDAGVTQETRNNLIRILETQKDAYLGAPVSLFEHNLQTASRALRAGEDDETVVTSLFHDMFETLAVKNHGELAASMLAPWVSPKSQWLLAHHEIFQGFYYFDYYEGLDKNKRDMFVDHVFYNSTVEWCEKYDQASFDPDYPSIPLGHFLPIVDRVLAKTQYWWNPSHPKAGAVSASARQRKEGKIDVVINPSGEENEVLAVPSGGPCTDTWTCYDSN